MEIWKAVIKEKDNAILLTPEYYFPEGGMFSGITDEQAFGVLKNLMLNGTSWKK